MANTLFILNDSPYGTERSYNAIRLATSLSKQEGERARVFLIGEAASCARANREVTHSYNIENMLGTLIKSGVEVAVCSSCMDARGISDGELVQGSRRSSMNELTRWTCEADKVLVF